MKKENKLKGQKKEESVFGDVIPWLPYPQPIPIPITLNMSGLYEWRLKLVRGPKPNPGPPQVPSLEPLPEPDTPSTQGMETEALFPWWFVWEELRLDVDGHYPQMVASGTIHGFLKYRIHWIANLKPTGSNSWKGTIWYKDGTVSMFPYTKVEIHAVRHWFPHLRKATVTFYGGGDSKKVRTYKFKSPYFHPVDFEFDCAEGEEATTSIETCAHPNRPDSLPCENLTIETVYRRTGFKVKTSPGDTVPISGAGPNARWSDNEMHDAMQTYWSRFSSSAQWAMWIFFASLHEMGTGLGGIMFDDIGPNHRQGTSLFNDSFISVPPDNDPYPDAWVQRMIFWTACHEMGHSFNLAHSWQKSLGTPWIPLKDEPEARSFMNYPFLVSCVQKSFFSDFEYRFSDQELLFMRHAPARFVQMGNADWFDHHGFQEANVSPDPKLKLELRINREKEIFEFMEPVTLELKLTNISGEPQLLDERVLSMSDNLVVVLKKNGKPARQFFPYAKYCWKPTKMVLKAGESIYESLSVSAGLNGWDISEPGIYMVQGLLQLDEEDLVSNTLWVRVAPPSGFDEELIAQDFFSDDVGRTVAFKGSRFFEKANDTLREVTERLKDRRVSLHAAFTLGNEFAYEYKQLVEDKKEPRKQLGIKIQKPKPKEAAKLLSTALTAKSTVSVESIGHINFKRNVNRFSEWLKQEGAVEDALKCQDILYKTMSARKVHGRPVLDAVLRDMKNQREKYVTK